MFARIYVVSVLLLSLMLAGCATTQTGGPTVDSGAVIVAGEDFKAAIVFGDSDRRKIRDYYRGQYKAKPLPPGLAKKHPSHPGLRNHLEKYGQLPPGIETHRLPIDLERTLRRLPDGYLRVRVGGDILLMNERTRYVLDMIFDVD